MHPVIFPRTRRDFFRTAAAVTSLAATNRLWCAESKSAAELLPGKHERMIVYKRNEMETPLELLRDHAVTPKELLFVRNNQVADGAYTLSPAENLEWRIAIEGLATEARSITLTDLAKLPRTEVEMVLQCSGNGRANFESAAHVHGSPWKGGAMANVRFGGVRLAHVFEHLKVDPRPEAKFITAEGADQPDGSYPDDFEHSLPLGDLLERAIIATHLNGEPLPRVHGGPVRLAIPGYYGTMQIKWLSRLLLTDRESRNHHHVRRYRSPRRLLEPGEKFESTLENSDAHWKMRIKSVIFAPLQGEQIAANKEFEVRGVAFNDGDAPITAVEFSTDRQTWLPTTLKAAASPYGWYSWSIAWRPTPGKNWISARAVDALGRTQPLNGAVFWNPEGYCWNGVDTVEIVAV